MFDGAMVRVPLGDNGTIEPPNIRRFEELLFGGCPPAASAFLLTRAAGAIRLVLDGDVSGELEIQLVREIGCTVIKCKF